MSISSVSVLFAISNRNRTEIFVHRTCLTIDPIDSNYHTNQHYRPYRLTISSPSTLVIIFNNPIDPINYACQVYRLALLILSTIPSDSIDHPYRLSLLTESTIHIDSNDHPYRPYRLSL